MISSLCLMSDSWALFSFQAESFRLVIKKPKADVSLLQYKELRLHSQFPCFVYLYLFLLRTHLLCSGFLSVRIFIELWWNFKQEFKRVRCQADFQCQLNKRVRHLFAQQMSRKIWMWCGLTCVCFLYCIDEGPQYMVEDSFSRTISSQWRRTELLNCFLYGKAFLLLIHSMKITF